MLFHLHDSTAVCCLNAPQYGETFVNKVYSVADITELDFYDYGTIIVYCNNNGTITPGFFDETYNWCRSKALETKTVSP